MQGETIFISVLVPVYNVPENLLRQCLNSLLSQTLEQTEFILVDDGSTNNSGQICEEFATKDDRIIVKHQQNSGLSGARNTAFSSATGVYIMFLDGDDYLAPQACEQVYKIIKKRDVDVVFGNIKTQYSHSTVVTKPFLGESRSLSLEEVDQLQANGLDFNAKIGQVFGKAIKREILTKNNIIHQAKLKQGAEDIVFNFELFAKVQSAYYLNQTLNNYVYNEQSISHSPDIKSSYLVIKCFSFVQDIIKQEHYPNKKDLLRIVDVRLLYVIVTTAISGVFNPSNKASYQEKFQEYKRFLQNNTIQHALENGDRSSLSKLRKIILWLVDHNYFRPIQLLAWGRKLQYKNR